MPVHLFIWILMVLFLSNSCASHTNTYKNGTDILSDGKSLNTTLNASLYATNVYIGICGRMSLREKEMEYAKFHIAHQIAMNRKCTVDYGYVSVDGTKNDDHAFYDSNFDYDDNSIDEILEHITVLEEYRLPNFTVLIGEDTSVHGYDNYKIERIDGKRPDWVRSMPGIEGYYVGIGTADRYSELYKSILVADVEAAQMIAKEKYLYIQGFTYEMVEEGIMYNSKLTNGNIFISQADLYGFYILDRWIEPDGTCYSLAIAKKE